VVSSVWGGWLGAATALASALAFNFFHIPPTGKFTIVDGDWLPGGDELTPTMKLKRKPIAEKYAQEIEALYAG